MDNFLTSVIIHKEVSVDNDFRLAITLNYINDVDMETFKDKHEGLIEGIMVVVKTYLLKE